MLTVGGGRGDKSIWSLRILSNSSLFHIFFRMDSNHHKILMGTATEDGRILSARACRKWKLWFYYRTLAP